MHIPKYNIAWIFVDGVRRYHATDDRGRIKFMDKFAKESIEFLNVVTSAPSTYMSLGSMLSGLPSYYISRNFDDFRYESGSFPNLTSDLKQVGYNVYSFLDHKDTRETMLNWLPMIPREYWLKGLTHEHWWTPKEINQVLNNVLSSSIDTPAFFFVGHDCRGNMNISDDTEWVYSIFKKYGYTEDNTIFILCSDHGYPDQSKETGRPEYYKDRNLSHDLILTDDNIMIPFFIKYPGCEKGRKIHTTVSSIDLYSTVMDLLNLKVESKSMLNSKSWLPLINNDESYIAMMEKRFHRCDSRFFFQDWKGTVIRNGKYKYINYHGAKYGGGDPEEFFDIMNDPFENNNLIFTKEQSIIENLYEFQKEFNESENNAFAYQVEYLASKLIKSKGVVIKKSNNILLIDSGNPLFLKMLIEMIKNINLRINISLLRVEHDFDYKDINIIESHYKSWNVEIIKDRNIIEKIRLLFPDIIIIPFNTSEGRDNKFLKKFINRLPANEKIYLDYNLGYYKRTLLNYYWKKFKPMWHFVKHEPLYIVNFIYSNLIKYISKKREIG